MFTMNVPKFLWGEAMKTAAYLINQMPLRVLDNKSHAELLLNSNEFVVSPKVFGCVCFVHDYRNDIRKLDPRVVKCVFVGYSSTKKGYCCWCPSEHRFFISMDVTFREYEPFMSQPMILELLFLHLKDNKRGEGSVLVPPSVGSYWNNSVHGQGEEINNDNESGGNNSCHGDIQGTLHFQNIVSYA